jgi:elongation factor G
MKKDLKSIRNIGIMAHIDAGKTTVTERVLYFAGKIYKMGEVHDGTAVMDYMQEEQERGITITSAATKVPWQDYEINVIDTPGHVDFTAEVERSLRVLDGAITVLDGSEGVQAQTETVWRQGKKYDLSCIFLINKMDKIGADFEMTFKSIRDRLLANPVAVQIPIGFADSFEGIIDLVTMKAVYYEQLKVGAKFDEREIPENLREEAEHWRHDLLEKAAELDEELMELYVHDEPVSEQMIRRALRKGTINNTVNPVFCGSALKNIGVRRVVDGAVDYLPSPLDRPVVKGFVPGDDEKTLEITSDPNKPLAALAFKIVSDKHGDLYFLRIYQGQLKSNSRLFNPNRNHKENITRLFEMHASSRNIVDSAYAGEIVAAVGLKDTLTGDTLCDAKHPIQLESITFPETVLSMSIEPKTQAERDKLSNALAALRREDPTFGCKYNEETGQTIISGMGELHLEILEHKLVRDMKVNVRVGKPRVAYKEAITQANQGEGKFVRQTGGRGQYGHVVITIEPLVDEDGHFQRTNEFETKVVGGNVPREYFSAVQKGVKDSLSSGALAGYPVVGTKVTLIDGSHHPVDSSELAFEQAGSIAVQQLMSKSGPILLEPVMKVEVAVPEESYGVVQGSLIAKRGVITDAVPHGRMRVIHAKVPLAEMFGYSSEIRSMTAGRGTFVMEPGSYEKVPEQISEKILTSFY